MKLSYFLLVLMSIFLQSCQKNHETSPTDHTRTAMYNTQLGLAYFQQGDRPRAKHKLLLALTQAPRSPQTHAAMAYFLEKTGDTKTAEHYYQKAMTLSPNEGGQMNNYGAFLCREGRYSEAELYFLKAVRDLKYEHTAGAYENAGLCALMQSDQTKARHYFIQALKQDPERQMAFNELIHLLNQSVENNERALYLKKYPKLALHRRNSFTRSTDVEDTERSYGEKS